ncbi:MAG: HD domain-containing protein [Vulcanimicrobiota bacterium]
MNTISSNRNILRQEFKKELQGYYQLNGQKNGSPLEGTIYPPDIAPNDQVALEKRVDELSSFLAAKDGITFRPTPEFGKGRIEDRAQVASSASGWVKASGRVALEAATNMIGNPAVRAMVQEGLKGCEQEFFKAPSSKSGMFHPADEINEGGLALHTARVVQMGEHLGDFFGLNPGEKDNLRAGLVLHDSVKGGDPWQGYSNEHGELAGKFIQSLPGPADAKAVAAQIATNHMALWRQKNDGTPNPAVPDNKMDMIASLADYLAARDNIYVDAPGLDKSVPATSTPEEHMKPQTYTGTTKNRSKEFPRGMEITMHKEELKVLINGQTFTGKINDPEIKDGYLSYGGFGGSENVKNPLEGMSVKVNFWLLTGAKGGKVVLAKGNDTAEYFVRPPQA